MNGILQLIALLWAQQFIRFLLAGGLAAVANYGACWLLTPLIGYVPAIILAYLLGMLLAFLLMRAQVFTAHCRPLAPQIFKFIVINLLALLQTLLISILLAWWLLPSLGVIEQAEKLAHFVGVLVPVMTSYFGHRWLTFR